MPLNEELTWNEVGDISTGSGKVQDAFQLAFGKPTKELLPAGMSLYKFNGFGTLAPGAVTEPRAHLDIETDSIGLEIARLERLGATLVSRKDGWVVMQAPSGHRFCVGSPYRGGFHQGANTWK